MFGDGNIRVPDNDYMIIAASQQKTKRKSSHSEKGRISYTKGPHWMFLQNWVLHPNKPRFLGIVAAEDVVSEQQTDVDS